MTSGPETFLRESPEGLRDFLESVRGKGVSLWSTNGELRYRGPKGALTRMELETIRVSKAQILSLLDSAAHDDRPEPSMHGGDVPLAFSQLAHLRTYRLIGTQYAQRSVRMLAYTMRINGMLNLHCLRRSLAEIVRRHDALRTRIVVSNGVAVQRITRDIECEVRVDDLTSFPKELQESEAERLIEQLILEPVDIGVAPLFAVQAIRLGQAEHLLVAAFEHMISDAESVSIFVRELLMAYTQAVRGESFALPEVPVQFSEYALLQRAAEKSWIEKHADYWTARLDGCPIARFPVDSPASGDSDSWLDSVPLRIPSELKAQLSEWSRLRRTTIVMTVFTVYVALVLRWCGAPESVIQYQSNGRYSPKFENTIGYFASAFYLRVGLQPGDTFVDLLNRITRVYCEAFEHADSSYLTAQGRCAELTRSPSFNWSTRVSKTQLSQLDFSGANIRCSPFPWRRVNCIKLGADREPGVHFYDSDTEIIGKCFFSSSQFSAATMVGFVRNFLSLLRVLLQHPDMQVSDVVLVKQFGRRMGQF